MKFSNVIKKLSRFGFTVDENGAYWFWTRNNALANRQIKVINQNGSAIALPLFCDKSGQSRVVFHATTIKSLVQFLEGE